jgi:hypothetical protein
MFFWVFLRRQIVFYRRLGTLCQVHLQRRDVEPLKMDLTEGYETSEKHNLTPGKYPKEHIQEVNIAEQIVTIFTTKQWFYSPGRTHRKIFSSHLYPYF